MANVRGRLPLNGKLPNGAQLGEPIFTRQPNKPFDTDQQKTVFEYLAVGMHAMISQLGDLARQVDNRSRVVDEYQVQSSTVAAESVVTVQPIFDFVPEKIESVIITGPPGNITLQLGDRFWNLTIPATGVIVIAPVGILLNRNDLRQLTGTSGSYSLELMGIADERFDA